MNDDECSIWQGKESDYQEQAGLVLVESGSRFFAWCWVTSHCGNPCLNVDHLAVNYPQRLSYPHRVCVYCGQIAGTRDHLVPRSISGETWRRSVLTVPACGECNSLIGAVALYSITERREYAHNRLRVKRAKILLTIEYTREELDEFGPGLRPAIVAAMVEKRKVLDRLRWPTDPAYDLRALQKSGIEDPYIFGLLKHEEIVA